MQNILSARYRYCNCGLVILWSFLVVSCSTQRPVQPDLPIETPPVVEVEKKETQRDGLVQFRGNNQRNFFGTGPVSEQAPKLLWSFKTDTLLKGSIEWKGLGWTGQPAIVKEHNLWVVYAGSLDGYVYKLDLYTGKLLLKSPKNLEIIKSSPTLTDDFVIIGSWNNTMHLLDRETLEVIHQEQAIYTPSVSYDFDGSAAVEDGFAYFGGEDGYVRKISLTAPYQRIWVYPTEAPYSEFRYKNREEPYVGIESSVAIFKDKVIVGTGRGEVLILNKFSGEILSSYNTGDDTDSTPVIDGQGNIFIGVEKDQTEVPGGMLKLNSEGQQDWFFPVAATGVYSSAALHGDQVIFTSDDRKVYSLNKHNGQLLWYAPLYGASWSSPALVDNKVITADYAGYLYAFHAESGNKLWEVKLSSYVASTPAVWDGVIVLGTRDGFIRAYR